LYTITSIEENNNLSSLINVYPNPFNDEIKISNETNANLDITILDVMGKVISIEQSNSDMINLKTAELPQGIYVINVKSDKLSASYKIVK
jgi:hypothetical protein